MNKILSFAGSNSENSINRTFLKYVCKYLEKDIDYLELRDYNLPIYNIDVENKHGHPSDAKLFCEKIKPYKTLIISANEHNGVTSVFFKNFIDWSSRVNNKFLENKKIFLLSTSPGRGGAKMSLNYLEEVLPRFGAEIVSKFSLASFNHSFTEEEGITDEVQHENFEFALKQFQAHI